MQDLFIPVSETVGPIQLTHNLHHLPPVYFCDIFTPTRQAPWIYPCLAEGDHLHRTPFGNKHLHLLYVACFLRANTPMHRHTWEHSRRQIRTCMRTQKAFIAGGNNIVPLLRGQPQFCGLRGHIQEMLLLYMFITLPWKNKRLSHRHFLSSSLPSHLSKPVWERGGERLDEGWAHVTLHHFQK